MNLGIILPLVIYLVFIFGAALFAYVKRSKGDFLTEYYVGNRSMTGFVLAMTTASTYASASSFVGGPGAAYKIWARLGIARHDPSTGCLVSLRCIR